MLVHQAAEQLREWTGLNAPVEVMAEAFDAAR
jgi:shikimate 5-dehydrogenase